MNIFILTKKKKKKRDIDKTEPAENRKIWNLERLRPLSTGKIS